MRVFRIHLHRQLLNAKGEVVAFGGESVAVNHPDLLALEDPSAVGFFADDQPPKLDEDGLPMSDAQPKAAVATPAQPAVVEHQHLDDEELEDEP